MAIWAAAATYYSTPAGQRAKAEGLLVQAVCDALTQVIRPSLDSAEMAQVQAHVTRLVTEATDLRAFSNVITSLPQQISSWMKSNTSKQTPPPTQPTSLGTPPPAPRGKSPSNIVLPKPEEAEQPCAAGAPVCVRGNPQIPVALGQRRLQQQINALNQRLRLLQSTGYMPGRKELAPGNEAQQLKVFSQEVSAAKAALATLQQQLSALGGAASTELQQFLNQATATLQAMPQQFLRAKAHAYARAVQAVEQAMKLGQTLPYGTHAPAYKTLANLAQWYSERAGLNQFSRESRAGFEGRVVKHLGGAIANSSAGQSDSSSKTDREFIQRVTPKLNPQEQSAW